MANGHGGPRTPGKPAPVSGPGQLSRRTDGGPQQTNARMTGMGYGENADFMDIQSSAPLAATPSVSNMRSQNPSSTAQSVAATPLFSQTARPDEPVTAGADFGPGEGPAQPMNMGAGTTKLSDTLNRIYAINGSPMLLALAQQMAGRGL